MIDNQDINIKVGTPEPPKEEKKSALLKQIESKLVKIELKDKVYEYTVNIPNTVTELDLKGIPEDENAKVEISTQKIKDLKDNKILITVKNGNSEQKYTINVTINEIIDTNNELIDTTEFKENKSYKGKWIIISIFLIVTLMVSLILRLPQILNYLCLMWVMSHGK